MIHNIDTLLSTFQSYSVFFAYFIWGYMYAHLLLSLNVLTLSSYEALIHINLCFNFDYCLRQPLACPSARMFIYPESLL